MTNVTELEAKANELAPVTHTGPLWARMPGPRERLEGFSRSDIYLLINEGRIRSKSLRKPGCTRGIRLVHVPSLRAYIEHAGEEAPTANAANP